MPRETSAAGELLALWEAAAAAPPAERDEALLRTALRSPPASLGERNAALLRLRARLFGPTQSLRDECPACGATAEFAIDCNALAGTLLPAPEAVLPQQLEVEGYRVGFRLPNRADVRAAAQQGSATETFVAALLARCIDTCEHAGAPFDAAALPDAVSAQLSRQMETLEPGASIVFDLRCPDCAAGWTAPLQVADVIWSEVQARAERLLLDVDALARAYGWSEAQVLALSPTRRAAYLQLVGGA